MKLDKKYFPHFMAVMAVLSAMIIVYSSLRYQETRNERYFRSIAENDSLTTQEFRLLTSEGGVTIADYTGEHVVLVFWASWSDMSTLMLDELYTLYDQRNDLKVIAALVKDATETVDFETLQDGLIYVDGADMYNQLKVPGIPSYVLFGPDGTYKYAHVGYQEGAGYTLLEEKMNE